MNSIFRKMMAAAALLAIIFSFAACSNNGGENEGPSVIAQYSGVCKSGSADIAVNLRLYDKNKEDELSFVYEYGILDSGNLVNGKYIGTYSISMKIITFSISADEVLIRNGTTDDASNTISVRLLLGEISEDILLIKTL